LHGFIQFLQDNAAIILSNSSFTNFITRSYVAKVIKRASLINQEYFKKVALPIYVVEVPFRVPATTVSFNGFLVIRPLN